MAIGGNGYNPNIYIYSYPSLEVGVNCVQIFVLVLNCFE